MRNLADADENECGAKFILYTIAVWSICYAATQIFVFSWQTTVLKIEMDSGAFRRSQSAFDTDAFFNDPRYLENPTHHNRRHTTVRKSAVLEGLYTVQIINIISAVLLLLASVLLAFAVYSESHCVGWVWPAFIAGNIFCVWAFAIMRWSAGAQDVVLVLSIVQIAGANINLGCLVCGTVLLGWQLRRRPEVSLGGSRLSRHASMRSRHNASVDSLNVQEYSAMLQRRRSNQMARCHNTPSPPSPADSDQSSRLHVPPSL